MHHDDDKLDLIERDIAREASVLRDGVTALREQADGIASSVRGSTGRAYLIGCGDSLDGAIAARFVWDGLVRMPVEAVPSMTFVTSVVDLAPEGSLVVALSQSGRVSRVVEGVRAARARGLTTVTISASPDSPLAAEPADASWVIPFDKVGAVPGTTSFVLGGVALYELGCALAEDAVACDALRGDLDRLGALVERAIEACRPTAEIQAEAMAKRFPVLAMGYGPVLSSARYTVRKLFELAQLTAMWQETEEYAHDEYSLVGPDFRVMLFAPPDRGRSRSAEVAGYLRRLGVHLSVVTEDAEAERYNAVADVIHAIPDCPASLVPLLYSIPGQLMSLAAARRIGGSLYGMAERIHREDGDPQIYESEIAS